MQSDDTVGKQQAVIVRCHVASDGVVAVSGDRQHTVEFIASAVVQQSSSAAGTVTADDQPTAEPVTTSVNRRGKVDACTEQPTADDASDGPVCLTVCLSDSPSV